MTRPCTTWSATSACSAPAAGERKTTLPSDRRRQAALRKRVRRLAPREGRRRYGRAGSGGHALASPSIWHWYTAGGKTSLRPPALRSSAPRARSCLHSQNELTPPTCAPRAPRSAASRLRRQATRCWLRSAPPTCGLRARSCAFGDSLESRSCISSFSAPARPAPGSVCPAFAFRLPMRNDFPRHADAPGRPPPPRPPRLGRPAPCPCRAPPAPPPRPPPARASTSDAPSTPCCACPLGAVRLALRPSCRTALPIIRARPT